MGVLNRLFGSTESLAREMEADDEYILQHWKNYLGTISRKKKLVGGLILGSGLQKDLEKLKRLLELELVDISGEEKDELEILSDLKKMEHVERIKRVHRLEQCLMYAETKYEYVYQLLHQLHLILQTQMHLVMNLLAKTKKIKLLISHLQNELEVEGEIILKIKGVKTFHDLFFALVKGEHIIRTMNARERKLLQKMQEEFRRVFADEIKEGITYEWTSLVYNAVEDIVTDHEAIMAEGYDPHPDIEFEFVNGQRFAVLVQDVLLSIRGRKASESMLNVFLHLFREWYNHGRG